LWIGGTLAWQGWRAMHSQHPTAPPKNAAAAKPAAPAPAAPPSIDLPRLYEDEAGRVLDSYTGSQDNALDDFDWQKAELCLAQAIELGASGDAVAGQLALSRGYAILERLEDGEYSGQARAVERIAARTAFAAAAQATPQSPQPHLALARLSVYQEASPEHALAEFDAAEKLGAVEGRRQIEQEADAYRLRAEHAWSWADAQKARALYQRIPHFDQADRHVKELDRIHRSGRYHATYVRRRRWR